MRNLILFGLLIVLLLAAQFASAKTVDEVIDKYLKARGGRRRLIGIKSIYMEGTKEEKGNLLSVKIIKEQGRLSRTEIATNNENSFVLITDKGAWSYISTRSTEVDVIELEDLAGFKIELDIAGPLIDYASKGFRAELLGKEMVDDNRCYKIKLVSDSGKELFFWVDTSTWLLNQSASTTIDPAGGITLTLYKNYKEMNGILFAHSIESRSKQNETGNEINFTTIEVNPAIPETMYLPVIKNDQ